MTMTNAPVHTDGVYVIMQCPLPQYSDQYRVVNMRTGDESSYMTYSMCLSVIEHAKAGTLLGTFDLPQSGA